MSEAAAAPTVAELLRAHWRVIAACVLLAWCGAAVLIAMRPAVYDSEIELRIGAAIRIGADAVGPLPALVLLEQRTDLLARKASEAADPADGPRYPMPRVSQLGPDAVRLVARAPDPVSAQAQARGTGEAIVARHARLFADWQALEQSSLAALRDELALIDARVRDATDPAEQVRLAERRTRLAGRLALFRQLRASPQIRKTTIRSAATLPRHAASPNAAQILAAGTVIGASTGLLLALLPGLARPRR